MSIIRPWSDEQTGTLVTPWTNFGKEARIVTLFGNIMSSTDVQTIATDSIPFLAEELFASLMWLATENNDPVHIVINNNGGSIRAGFMIIQAIEHLQAMGIEVIGLDIGSSMSMATTVLAVCTKRFALRRSVIHVHPPSFGSPQMTDAVKEKVDEYQNRLKDELYSLLAQKTRIPEYCVQTEEVRTDDPNWATIAEKRYKYTKKFLEHERFLTPQQAKDAGIIDDELEAGDERMSKIFGLIGHKGGSL